MVQSDQAEATFGPHVQQSSMNAATLCLVFELQSRPPEGGRSLLGKRQREERFVKKRGCV